MTALRVLVVDDDTMIGALLAEMLAGMGYDVCGVEASEAGAVAAARSCSPDLIIMDAQLGDGSGVGAITRILSTGYVPHVFISGDVSRIRALNPGAIVLQKPFHEAQLARAIERAIATEAPG